MKTAMCGGGHSRLDRGRPTWARGLGVQFLRHIERTRVLVHLVDVSDASGRTDPVEDFRIIMAELKSFGHGLDEKPMLVVASKVDVANPDKLKKLRAMAQAAEVTVLCYFRGEWSWDPGAQVRYWGPGAVIARSGNRAGSEEHHFGGVLGKVWNEKLSKGFAHHFRPTYPGFPVEGGGVEQLYATFFERKPHTRSWLVLRSRKSGQRWCERRAPVRICGDLSRLEGKGCSIHICQNPGRFFSPVVLDVLVKLGSRQAGCGHADQAAPRSGKLHQLPCGSIT